MRTITAVVLSLIVAVVAGHALIGGLGCGWDAVGVEGLRVEFPQIAGPTGDPIIELAVDLPDAPSAMMIYRVKQAEVTPDAAAELAKRLGLDGEPTLALGAYTLGDESRFLSVWQGTGGISYNKGVLPFPESPPNLPSEEEAKRIAVEFLDKMGLSLRGAAIRESLGTVKMRLAGPTGSETYVCQLVVMFDCEIDGVPLCGDRSAVGIGNDGEVVHMVRVQRDVEPYRQLPIKSATQALEELREGKGTHNAGWDCERVVLDRVYLAYWMEGLSDPQEYVVPVYVFDGGSSSNGSGETQVFRGYVNAL